jgi:hypothetical protein
MSMKAKGESDRVRKLCKLGFVFLRFKKKVQEKKVGAILMGKRS